MNRLSNPMLTQRFILECIRAEGERDFVSLRNNFLKERLKIDWASIAQYSGKLLPMSYLRLARYRIDFSIPKPILAQMNFNYLKYAQRNQKIKLAIKALAHNCETAGIDVVFLKGAGLLATVYRKDESLRPMDDIDILVQEEKIPETEKVLIALGYTEDYERMSREFGKKLSRELFIKTHFHLVYYKDDMRLEMHWGIGCQTDKAIVRALWDSRTSAMLEETGINILSPDGAIFVASVNFEQDYYFIFPQELLADASARERAFYYLLFFINELKKISVYGQKDIRWGNLYSLARKNNQEYEIATLLLIARKALRARVPNFIVMRAALNPRICLFMLCTWFCPYDSLWELYSIRNRIPPTGLKTFSVFRIFRMVKYIYTLNR